MKYFIDEDRRVYAYESDGSQDEWILPHLKPINEKDALAIANPPPTHEQLVAQADAEKQYKITTAKSEMTLFQTKLLMGRPLKAHETERLNVLIDYIDALQEIDCNDAPNIAWPDVPNVA